MNNWRLLPVDTLPGSMNMAVDEMLMEKVGQGERPILRFYLWERPTLSVGYFQDARKQVDFEVCNMEGVDWVRRPTGGRAVLHQYELTYSVIVPLDYPDLPDGVTPSYLWLSKGLVTGLQQLGVPAEISDGSKGSRGQTAACFDSPSWYELTVDGKKLVGSAQTRREGVLLQHGSILLDLDTDLYVRCLKHASAREKQVTKRILANKATYLKAIIGDISYSKVANAIGGGFAKALGISFTECSLTDEETHQACMLNNNKYSTDGWNLERKEHH